MCILLRLKLCFHKYLNVSNFFLCFHNFSKRFRNVSFLGRTETIHRNEILILGGSALLLYSFYNQGSKFHFGVLFQSAQKRKRFEKLWKHGKNWKHRDTCGNITSILIVCTYKANNWLIEPLRGLYMELY